MAKLKTHRGSAKRFKRTASGELKRFKAYKSHITGKKSPKRIRSLRKGTLVSKSDMRRISHMIP
ncbi:50S ribosomal protein L35 [Ezakiella peruensis]|uniref:50S ribosomal protein L35 n=1 Tax=Ezakiella peruensis TaxID=1464038 RepID=UPI000C1B1944|nr:50S ribosomal protein L35 [Ezakiella peruensis]